MHLVLYQSSAERERVDKSAYLVEVASMEGTLKAPSSVVNPTIIVELPLSGASSLVDVDNIEVVDDDNIPVVDGLQDSLLRFNYAYIQELRRYYFVNDVTLITAKLYQMNLTCDLLMTYKGEFLPLTAYIERNEFEYDPLFVDGIAPYESTREISLRAMEKGNLVNFSFDTDLDKYTSRNIAVHTITKLTDRQSYDDIPSLQGLPQINPLSYSLGAQAGWSYRLTYGQFNFLSNVIHQHEEYASFYCGAVAFPFDIAKPSTGSSVWEDAHLYIENTYINELGYVKCYGYGLLSGYWVLADETFDDISSYEETNPYQSIEFYLPYYGFTEIDPKSIAGKRILIIYTCSMLDGNGQVMIYDATDEAPLFTASVKLGVQLGITTENIQELERLKTTLFIKTSLSVLSGMGGMIGGAYGGDAKTMMKGAGDVIDAAAGVATTYINMVPRASVALPSSDMGLMNLQEVQIRITRMKRAIADESNYAHCFGKPLQKSRALNSLHGFTRIGKIHLDGVTAFSSEAQSLSALLESGVILP